MSVKGGECDGRGVSVRGGEGSVRGWEGSECEGRGVSVRGRGV